MTSEHATGARLTDGFDVVVSGGRLVDPGAGRDGRYDIGVVAGKVVEVASDLSELPAGETIDATGKLVVPGLIDVHTHAFAGYHGAAPDCVSLRRGTTTVIDAGSTGANGFDAFRKLIVDQSRTRVRSWLNISTIGLIDIRVGELMNLIHVSRDDAVKIIDANRDVIVGIKIRISEYVAGADFRPALRIAVEVAETTDLPIMMHIGSTNVPLDVALAFLRPGDVVTHMFTGMPHGLFDPEGELLEAVRAARNNGIVFDGAHGRRHLSFESVRRCFQQGFAPDTMSSDISHRAVADRSYHLPLVISKLMGLGYELEQLIPMVTVNPARMILHDQTVGTLSEGSDADLVLLDLVEEPVTFTDSMGSTLQGSRRLEPVRTMIGGEIVEASDE